MMKMWLIYSVLVLSMCGSARGNAYRTFTSDDGREIEARIVEHDSRRGRIKVERKGGGVAWMEPDMFGDADQRYIQHWIAASFFLVPQHVQVSAERETVGRAERNQVDMEYVNYKITVMNKSKQPMRDLTCEYKYYVICKGKGQTEDYHRVVEAEDTLGNVAPNRSIGLKSNSVRLESLRASEDHLQGIWIRVYGPKVEGEPVYRDFTFPQDLGEKVSWNDKGIPFSERVRLRMRDYQTQMFIADDAVVTILNADNAEFEDIYLGLECYANGGRTGSAAFIAYAFLERGREDLYASYLQLCHENGELTGWGIDPLLSEMYSSSPNPKYHDGKKAVAHARAFGERRRESPVVHDLLARALARSGKYKEAEAEQLVAIERLGHHRDVYLPSFNARLELYRNNEAYVRGEDDVPLWQYTFYEGGEVLRTWPATTAKETSPLLRTSGGNRVKPK